MAKRTNKASLKGLLEVDFALGTATVTEVTKDNEYEYDFFKLLNDFNNKTVSISISENYEIPSLLAVDEEAEEEDEV